MTKNQGPTKDLSICSPSTTWKKPTNYSKLLKKNYFEIKPNFCEMESKKQENNTICVLLFHRVGSLTQVPVALVFSR